ncbi:MAG: transcriptional regulator GcvA [Burkholderiales bacterium]|nr:transcriptional regulator GcvA [Burkholderiales bacterium]
MQEHRRSLPSLDLLRGFEAAARNLSFTKAAAELFVTQSAVSRQVKTIEEHLGVALFARSHRALRLTEAGHELYRATAQALRELSDAASRIRQRGASRALTVTATIGFSSLWLIPRLTDFRSQRPEADIRISANNTMLDLEREGIEVAIRYCEAKAAPDGAIKLFGEVVLPVCSPNLVTRTAPLAKPEDLRKHVLLHYERPEGITPWLSWTVWLETIQLGGLKPAGSLRFSQYDQTIRAAIDGQGVALGTSPLVRQMIKQGRLIAPLAKKFESARAYYLVISAQAARRPDVQEFADWLTRQAKEESRNRGGIPRRLKS